MSSTDLSAELPLSDPKSAAIASQAYMKKAQALIRLITDLRALGAQADVDLPRIAVIGNQSAGKSSLVEAISGITVPRASGTCTRCPMECRLSYSSEPWTCQVYLRIEKDSNASRVEKVKETKFGPLLRNRNDLEDMLKRAQLAILNPSVAAESFVSLDLQSSEALERLLGSSRQLQFSANVVCLDLSSPDSADLSFIDLPGIISNVADGEDPDNIDLIKNLVQEHIAGNALILLTITMRDDIQNQSAALLAKTADANGLRTIGVLTKPDTLQEGEHAPWLDILAGKTNPLKHGYYVTKQAAISELEEELSYEESRNREHTFFGSGTPWKEQDTKIRSRMGVPNLTKQLSKLLSQLIEKTLPKLRQDSRQLLSITMKELNDLPPETSREPMAELLKLIATFASDLSSHVIGHPGHEALIQKCRSAYSEFKMDILSTRPNFEPFPRKVNKRSYAEAFEKPAEVPATPIDADDEDREEQKSDESPLAIDDDALEKKVASAQEIRHIDDVRKLVNVCVSRELPYNTPFSAKLRLIKECFQSWPMHTQTCFHKVLEAYQNCLFNLIKCHFQRFFPGGLHDRVRDIVEAEIERTKQATLDRISWLLELENPPFTQNDHYFSSYREKYLTFFRAQREAMSFTKKATSPHSRSGSSYASPRAMGFGANSYPPSPPSAKSPKKAQHSQVEEDMNPIQVVLKGLIDAGYKNVREEDLTRLRGPDPYEQELIVMAEVEAYFRVSYKRVIDNLPRIIDHDFLVGLESHIHDALIKGLRLDDAESKEKAKTYLSEDPDITIRRVILEQNRKRLEAINSKLNNSASFAM